MPADFRSADSRPPPPPGVSGREPGSVDRPSYSLPRPARSHSLTHPPIARQSARSSRVVSAHECGHSGTPPPRPPPAVGFGAGQATAPYTARGLVGRVQQFLILIKSKKWE